MGEPMAVSSEQGVIAGLSAVAALAVKGLVDVVRRRVRAEDAAKEGDSPPPVVLLVKMILEQQQTFFAEQFRVNRELIQLQFAEVRVGLAKVENDLLAMHTRYHDLAAPLTALETKMALLISGAIQIPDKDGR